MMRNVYSVIIYLNQEFTGGATRMCVDMSIDVKPKIGRCLVLNQGIEHMGCVVGEGKCKYILRTDLLDYVKGKGS